MLKTVEYSTGKKTRGLAVTYRAGDGEKYGTCPASCALNCSGKGAQKIDAEYLDALLDAVPAKGISFTYTHFPWSKWADKLGPGKTVINYSADTFAAADAADAPTVVVVPPDFWGGKKAVSRGACQRPVVRCPEEYRKGFGCANCGNGEPLCARLDRNFIVGFTAHGAGKKKRRTRTRAADVMLTAETSAYIGVIRQTKRLRMRLMLKSFHALQSPCRGARLSGIISLAILAPGKLFGLSGY